MITQVMRKVKGPKIDAGAVKQYYDMETIIELHKVPISIDEIAEQSSLPKSHIKKMLVKEGLLN